MFKFYKHSENVNKLVRDCFWELDSPVHFFHQLLEGEFAKNLSHEVDGLIFQPVPDVSVCSISVYHVKNVFP